MGESLSDLVFHVHSRTPKPSRIRNPSFESALLMYTKKDTQEICAKTRALLGHQRLDPTASRGLTQL